MIDNFDLISLGPMPISANSILGNCTPLFSIVGSSSYSSAISMLYQWIMLSINHIFGLALLLLPFMILKIDRFTSLELSIRQMCPKRPSFLWMIIWVMFFLILTESLILSFLIQWNCPTLMIQWSLQNSNVTRHCILAVFSVQVFTAIILE